MRWTETQVGDQRIVRKFLWWPMCLKGQNRWLERVNVRQVYVRTADGSEFWNWVEFIDGDVCAGPVPSSYFSSSPPPGSEEPSIVDPAGLGIGRTIKTAAGLRDRYSGEILVGMGTKAIPILLRMGQAELPVIHPILRKIGAETAVPALIESLGDREASVRQMAAILLWFPYLKPRSAEASDRLIESIRDENPGVRQAALRSVSAVSNPEVSIPVLIDSLRDDDPFIRVTAASLLEQLGPLARSAVPWLTAAMKDETVAVRDAATAALRTIQAAGDVLCPSESNRRE